MLGIMQGTLRIGGSESTCLPTCPWDALPCWDGGGDQHRVVMGDQPRMSHPPCPACSGPKVTLLGGSCLPHRAPPPHHLIAQYFPWKEAVGKHDEGGGKGGQGMVFVLLRWVPPKKEKLAGQEEAATAFVPLEAAEQLSTGPRGGEIRMCLGVTGGPGAGCTARTAVGASWVSHAVWGSCCLLEEPPHDKTTRATSLTLPSTRAHLGPLLITPLPRDIFQLPPRSISGGQQCPPLPCPPVSPPPREGLTRSPQTALAKALAVGFSPPTGHGRRG